MSPYTVNVSNIAPSTTKDHLHDFFTFCGKIVSIDYKQIEHHATISFEKANAAETALMLNGGALDGSTLQVTSDTVHPNEDHPSDHPIDQSDKPRAGIAAEYLAKGYILTDDILQRSIEMDKKHGISKRFLDYFHSIDKTVGEKALGQQQTVSGKVHATVEQATKQARAMDEQRGFSKIANDYYKKAISSPWGQRVWAFYTQTSKQVKDIHEEARRIAEQEKSKASSTGVAQYPPPTSAPEAKTRV